ncbi:hypothetical protein OsJ_04812 [Oryza sativa Japonica Group]|uniref:Uncharacterized protein n=1 Tax=Oryza sativa subsp. japonica TaxID=39947 RepID=B9EWI7_ORYSJ|nr:hypothetical protein OsJ_04812 [Oryza sativa Japonica Group]
MGLHYEQYDAEGHESSLSRKYGLRDVVVSDPEAAKRDKGWGFVARVYLGGQNVTLDLSRFRHTLTRLHARALRTRRTFGSSAEIPSVDFEENYPLGPCSLPALTYFASAMTSCNESTTTPISPTATSRGFRTAIRYHPARRQRLPLRRGWRWR